VGRRKADRPGAERDNSKKGEEKMFMIKDSDGETIKLFKRHRGARRYAAHHGGVLRVSIDVKNGFWLNVLFGNATTSKMKFSNYGFMKSFILNWSAAQNKQLVHCGAVNGVVSAKNPILM
jgi:hypothetical protein